jgi:hypothetical protein
VSLRQAAAIDAHFEGWTKADFDRLPESEVTHDWTQIPEEDLRRDNIPHLDPDGLRYYLPALMLWLLDHYDDAEDRLLDVDTDLTVIGTIHALAPGHEFRQHHYGIYDARFTPEQRGAIAAYIEALPHLVALDPEDATLVARSVRDYWKQFLTHEA